MPTRISTLKQWLITAILCLFTSATSLATATLSISLTLEEQTWIAKNQEKNFSVGFDPYAGMDYFEFRGARTGFLPALLDDMQKQLGLRLSPANVSSWDKAYNLFIQGKIDILYGANPTPERERIMVFTSPAMRYPYAAFARKDSSTQTLGDLDGKKVGFIDNDFVSQRIPREYPNIRYSAVNFSTQEEGLKALISKNIDGFITSGGGIEHEFLFSYPDLTMIAELQTITSDMTFAVLKEQAILGSIFNKYLQLRKNEIQNISRDAARTYNQKILRLTDAELKWLEQKGEAVVGVADDYLPFDLYQNGQYKGIAGETLKAISEITGIRFKVVNGSFAEVYEKARTGSIDVLNIAKTEDRLRYFLYPRPISTERDIIIGLKTSDPVHDVYGLENKRVAVIDGFWHEEYLRKNLKKSLIVKTQDIMESLRLLRQGKVDYLIENPTVVEFYINGLGYTDLVKRGTTSKDSFVYFGVNRNQPELASIMDKALTLVKFEDMKYAGIQSVPTLENERSRQLTFIVIGLAVALGVILLITVRVVRSLINQKAQTQILKEREHLLYTDTLTGFHNRNYLSHITPMLEHGIYPQAILVADLNNLKPVNDTYGHATGDALLVLFASIVRETFPDGQVFRTGGDEFLIIMNNTSEEQAIQAIESLQPRCANTQHIVAEKISINPSAAVGYFIRNSDNDLLDAAICSADSRMYEVKANMKTRRLQT